MKERYIPPEERIHKDILINEETGKPEEVDVMSIAAVDLNPGDLDEIVDEVVRTMYMYLSKYPKLRRKPLLSTYYKAIRDMYRRKHLRLVQLIDLLKDNDRVNIHTATEEQIAKIGSSEETTPLTLSVLMQEVVRNYN
jgi:hypothetical protein